MVTAQSRPLTYDALLQMPDDRKRYEIINGELIVSPAPSLAHQLVLARLFKIVSAHVDKRELGEVLFAPVDVRLSPHNIVEPDLLFLRRDRFDAYKRRGLIDGPPDLVVEIISSSSTKTDTINKAALYAQMGVPEYWLVDPETRALRIQTLHDGVYADVASHDDQYRSAVINGLTIAPGDLFAVLD